MKIRVWVKGRLEDAVKAAAQHGLILEAPREVFTGGKGRVETIATVGAASGWAVSQWFAAPCETVLDLGFPPGTLLMYSDVP